MGIRIHSEEEAEKKIEERYTERRKTLIYQESVRLSALEGFVVVRHDCCIPITVASSFQEAKHTYTKKAK